MRDLEADLAICEAATPGPWELWQMHGPWQELRSGSFPIVACLQREDAKFVSAARTGWPEAIRRALASEERVDKLENELRMLHDIINSNKA